MNLPGNYSPHGRVHRVLDRLDQAPAKIGHLMASQGYSYPVRESLRRKFWRLIDHMKEHGLIEPGDGCWFITRDGQNVLRYLDAMHGQCSPPGVIEGEDAPRPTVRIFSREATA